MSRRGGVIVVKYGGSAMEDPTKVSEILQEIAGLAKEGFPVVLVHGGGKEISGEMDRKGLKAVFAQGFRVTDEAAMAVVEEVLDQRVNPGIVKKLNELGGKSRGISGRKRTGWQEPRNQREEGFSCQEGGESWWCRFGAGGRGGAVRDRRS
ncbi:hypothetical protein EBS57_04285 [bacterium]|nr:hypothetical protein [bacterium]